ncbi:hypothetical protein GH714_011207 [Hevea brasiliensis]|uniref:EamA domain-containing protein n=1 Tax=Hevea brasiliensis TaxID=3981 RepID=A0A6A6MV41_HEVBR|nr:hypothetical protein GH714_011207 [Hevea brasiliensis]
MLLHLLSSVFLTEDNDKENAVDCNSIASNCSYSDERMEKESARPSISMRDKMSNWKTQALEAHKRKPISQWILLLSSVGAMLVAFPASSLLSRVYYANGGTSKWIISWVAVAGWPLTALILLPTYFFCKTFPTPLTLKLILSYIVLGFLSAADNLMYAYAYAYLPASTASLLASSSLVFSALCGYFIVKNKLNASMINAIVIITVAITIIALDSDSDRYDYVSDHQYIMGFIWDILGSALHGLIFALSELVFIKLLGKDPSMLYWSSRSWFLSSVSYLPPLGSL